VLAFHQNALGLLDEGTLRKGGLQLVGKAALDVGRGGAAKQDRNDTGVTYSALTSLSSQSRGVAE
jgi:hypothetical protein